MNDTIINSDYEKLNNLKKVIWEHYRLTVIVVAQFTELLIAEVAELKSNLEPVILDGSIDRETYEEYKKALKYLLKQTLSFEKKVDYDTFENIDASKLNVSNILSWAGQVRTNFLRLVRVTEKICFNNNLKDVMNLNLKNINVLAENIFNYTRVCRLDASLFLKSEYVMENYIAKFKLFDKDSTFANIKTITKDDFPKKARQKLLLPKDIRQKLLKFENNDLKSNINTENIKRQANEIVELCNEFMQSNTQICVATIIEFINNFREIILDCNVDIKQYRKVESQLLEVIKGANPSTIKLKNMEMLYNKTQNYMKTIRLVVKNNPLLNSFEKTHFDMINNLFDRMFIVQATANDILEESKVQTMVTEFNKDYNTLEIYKSDIIKLIHKAYIVLENNDNLYDSLSEFANVQEVVAKFDEKWGNGAYFCGAPVGGSYFKGIEGAYAIANDYKKYYEQCGLGGHCFKFQWESEPRLDHYLVDLIRNNDTKPASYSTTFLYDRYIYDRYSDNDIYRKCGKHEAVDICEDEYDLKFDKESVSYKREKNI